ncbi:angiogenic factor with G patch and FHA domains 1-like isoform X2 [Mercenaria mercenaria]|uniref:angiogenic factor with G patch and FHA domains 1-like isoform X2 n=1 Tax=Mercenaria mercenaria TaxID=6596 RepID=UPI00234F0281|nr:angiogenic factor with G patch and FHA domains 1-like isoform X2 [Mercenaria mercenaria]
MTAVGKLTDTELLGLISQTTQGSPNVAFYNNQEHEVPAQDKVNDVKEEKLKKTNEHLTPALELEAERPDVQADTLTLSDAQSHAKNSSADFNLELSQSVLQSSLIVPHKSETVSFLQAGTQSDLTFPVLTVSQSEFNTGNSLRADTQSVSAAIETVSSAKDVTQSAVNSQKSTVLHFQMSSESGSQVSSSSIRLVSPTDIKSPSYKLDAELVSMLSQEEIINLVHEYRTEVEITKKKLERSERQLTKANNYNDVLRNMVEKLSSEIHQVKHGKTCSVHVQVDKDDFLAYTTGRNTMPNWNNEDEQISMPMETSQTPEVPVVATSERTSTQQPGVEMETVSIADSIKQAAEAAVQQQQADMLHDQGYVYDEHSGLYYHSATGYYYDQHKSLFYDPKSGIYYYFDYDTGEYLFHSQIELTSQTTEQSAVKVDVPAEKKKLTKTPKKNRSRERYSSGENSNRMEEGMMSQVLSGMEDLKISQYARNARKHALEVAGSYPPCIRVMVTESEYLQIGTLYIVTCTGAKIGRENCDICVPDVNVSKVHAEIRYNQSASQYEIFDLASQNGTFLNSQRLSPAKIASEPFALSHDDNLLISTTKLLCHIHTGYDTCDQCEPGVVIATHKAHQPQTEMKVMTKEERLRQKKQELNQIKKKYGLKNSAYEDNTEVFNNPNYTNKAEERRKFVGSDVPGQKQEAPASVHRPISTGNIGHKMLQKMGWKEGDTLGKNNTGIQEPISVTLRASQKAGLGSASAGAFSADDVSTVDMKKANRRIQAQERYKQIESEKCNNEGTASEKQWTQGDSEFT